MVPLRTRAAAAPAPAWAASFSPATGSPCGFTPADPLAVAPAAVTPLTVLLPVAPWTREPDPPPEAPGAHGGGPPGALVPVGVLLALPCPGTRGVVLDDGGKDWPLVLVRWGMDSCAGGPLRLGGAEKAVSPAKLPELGPWLVLRTWA